VRLPDGSRLLHIGPHKTGTTTIQAALHQSRGALADQGVHYPGTTAHPMLAALSAAGGSLPTVQPAEGERRWRELVDDVAASEARVTVLSSEFFRGASADRIGSILQALDAERTHVVVTLRPLCRVLASQWQHYMQNRPGLKYDDDLTYEGWLEVIFNRPEDETITPSFWRRHRHDRLIRKWVEIVGSDMLTAIVVDEADRRMVLHSFDDSSPTARQILRELAARARRRLRRVGRLHGGGREQR